MRHKEAQAKKKGIAHVPSRWCPLRDKPSRACSLTAPPNRWPLPGIMEGKPSINLGERPGSEPLTHVYSSFFQQNLPIQI